MEVSAKLSLYCDTVQRYDDLWSFILYSGSPGKEQPVLVTPQWYATQDLAAAAADVVLMERIEKLKASGLEPSSYHFGEGSAVH